VGPGGGGHQSLEDGIDDRSGDLCERWGEKLRCLPACSQQASDQQSVAVGSLHPAVAAPLGDVVTRRLSFGVSISTTSTNSRPSSPTTDVWRSGTGRGPEAESDEAFLTRQLKLWVITVRWLCSA